MDTLNLYKIADNEKIDIENCKWTNAKARIFELDNSYYIGLDNSKLNNSIDEKQVLAEELGHYYYSAYYPLNSDKEFIDKQEYKALKWKSLICVPLKSILSCFYKRNI